MAKIYVIDTSALISNPNVVKKSRRHGVIAPAVVLRQLDGLKNSSNGNTAYWARKASQAIERQQRKNNFLIEGASVTVNSLDNAADNEIIGTALYVKRNTGRYTSSRVKDVVLVSTDRNMRIAAVNYGLTAEDGNGSERKTWKAALLSAYTLTAVSFLSLMVPHWISSMTSYSIKWSDDTCGWLAITIGVCFVILIITAIGYRWTFPSTGTARNSNDDILLDPICSQIPGNIFHDTRR